MSLQVRVYESVYASVYCVLYRLKPKCSLNYLEAAEKVKYLNCIKEKKREGAREMRI